MPDLTIQKRKALSKVLIIALLLQLLATTLIFNGNAESTNEGGPTSGIVFETADSSIPQDEGEKTSFDEETPLDENQGDRDPASGAGEESGGEGNSAGPDENAKTEPHEQEEDQGERQESENVAAYDPQPTSLEDVQTAIDTYTAADDDSAAKPRWEHDVPAEYMPEGYSCALVEDDAAFGLPYYTFFEIEAIAVVYDPQPSTIEEVQAWIDLFNTTLAAEGFLAALAVKPHWEFMVEQELMPLGYFCELAEPDMDFGMTYYSFFAGVAAAAVSYNDLLSQISTVLANGAATIHIAGSFAFTGVIPIGSGKNITIVSDGGPFTLTQTSGRHFSISGGATLTLDNITLTGGNAGGGVAIGTNGGSFIMESGATIENCKSSGGGAVSISSNGSFTLNGGTIQNNQSSGNGGGVHLSGASARFTMNGGIIAGNVAGGETASSNLGGGVSMTTSATFTMNGGTISGNTGKTGGGVYVTSNSVCTINNGLITGNTATWGGGGGLYFSHGRDCSVSNSSITDNRETGDDVGGGIAMYYTDLTMTDVTVSGNQAGLFGGGVYLIMASSFTATGCTFSGNSAEYGGGILVDAVETTSAITLNGCSVTGNNAIEGGGIYLVEDCTVAINGGSITMNTATGDGGGIYTEAGVLAAGETGLYGNLHVNSTVTFSGNGAQALYNPTQAQRNAAVTVASTSCTVPVVGHPINNYDINYVALSPASIVTVTVKYYQDSLSGTLLGTNSFQYIEGELIDANAIAAALGDTGWLDRNRPLAGYESGVASGIPVNAATNTVVNVVYLAKTNPPVIPTDKPTASPTTKPPTPATTTPPTQTPSPTPKATAAATSTPTAVPTPAPTPVATPLPLPSDVPEHVAFIVENLLEEMRLQVASYVERSLAGIASKNVGDCDQ